MRSVAGEARGSWSEAVTIIANVTLQEPSGNLPLVLGTSITFAILGAVILFCIILLIVYLVTRQYRLYKSVKSDGAEGTGFDLWRDNYAEHFIPEGLVEGKELVVDEWEIPTSDVIVENHLGEGAFGLVFKGIISAPLRNPKLSAKLRQTIGLPVAIKLLKETASNKERKDFWTEIDMMKKISEGYCNHIVNMVGCVTLQEPLCLITEFVPHGDLLEYLRSQRKKNATRNREEKQLRMQLEQQRKAYAEMKRQMEILQSAQSDAPGEGHLVAGATGYADFQSTDNEGGSDNASVNRSNERTPFSIPPDESLTAALIPPRSSPYTNMRADGSVAATSGVAGDAGEGEKGEEEEEEREKWEEGEEREKGAEEEEGGKEGDGEGEGQERVQYQASGPAPYLEAGNEYSHLDPSPVVPEEEEPPAEPREELGDLETNDLMQFAYQIATGMEYLSSINIVHRDLACRNILVGEGKSLKITDFGLSREVEDVYVKTTKGRLPLKWMALESIDAREFTTASDVWSYGVVLWEIGTLGGFPYPTVQNQDLLSMLKQGYRLEKPDSCGPEVYDIMLECWQEHPQDRPTFSQLREKFSNLLLATTGDAYMELEVDNSKVYYTVADEDDSVRERKDSESSVDSDDSTIKKPKKKKFVEKPKWAQAPNAYVATPSTFKDDHIHVEDEHYRVPADAEGLTEVVVENGVESSTNIEASETVGSLPQQAADALTSSLTPSLSAKPTLEDPMGIPLSFMPGEKPAQTAANGHKAITKTRTNPYVDDPATKQLLAEEDIMSLGSLGKTGSFNIIQDVAASLGPGESVTSL